MLNFHDHPILFVLSFALMFLTYLMRSASSIHRSIFIYNDGIHQPKVLYSCMGKLIIDTLRLLLLTSTDLVSSEKSLKLHLLDQKDRVHLS